MTGVCKCMLRYVGWIYAKITCVPIYNIRQMLQSKCVTLSRISGVASRAANTPAAKKNTTLYLITCARASG